MEMAAGGAVSIAGVADVADEFSLADVFSFGNGCFTEVGVNSFRAVRMFNFNIGAVAAVPSVRSGFNNQPFGCRVNGSAAAVGDVNGVVVV